MGLFLIGGGPVTSGLTFLFGMVKQQYYTKSIPR